MRALLGHYCAEMGTGWVDRDRIQARVVAGRGWLFTPRKLGTNQPPTHRAFIPYYYYYPVVALLVYM